MKYIKSKIKIIAFVMTLIITFQISCIENISFADNNVYNTTQLIKSSKRRVLMKPIKQLTWRYKEGTKYWDDNIERKAEDFAKQTFLKNNYKGKNRITLKFDSYEQNQAFDGYLHYKYFYYTDDCIGTVNSTVSTDYSITTYDVKLLKYNYNLNKKNEKKIKEIIKKLKISKKDTEYQAVKKIYDWFCKDSGMVYNDKQNTIEDVLYKNTGACSSFSVVFKYLLNEIGIECDLIGCANIFEIGGYGHAWNRVKIDNKWYYLDITWDLNLQEIFKGTKDYSFYLVSFEDIYKNDHSDKSFEEKDKKNHISYIEKNVFSSGRWILYEYSYISPKYITIKYNKGYNNPNPTKIKAGNTSKLKKPTRKGYVFKGWYTSDNYKTRIVSLKSITKNTTLYAKWRKQ